jgi:hypothetical protein
MKPIKLLLFFLLSACLLTACRKHRRTVIVTSSPGVQLRIEYGGKVHFNDAGTDIEAISPGGYVKYTKNGETLEAESDRQGVIIYRLNGGEKQITLDDADRQFVAGAVKEMIREGHNADR